MIAKLNTVIKQDFTVIDYNNVPAVGLDETSFTYNLFDPDNNIVSPSSFNISELGNGSYRVEFLVDKTGTWYLILFNDMYFPWGKADTIQVYEHDFDSIAFDVSKILGLTQENYLLDELEYDSNGNLISGRIRIYSDSLSIGTSQNVISTYHISADWNDKQLTNYKVERI
ncbi:MAG: hypothetical protein ACTSPQ_15100 [Candidatus Helarchaeota archaeon]